jgi:hypothetical protein
VRLLFATLTAATIALGSYVAFSEGPNLIRNLVNSATPAAHKAFVPPSPAPKTVVETVEPPEPQSVAPLQPGVIPGMRLPPPKSK